MATFTPASDVWTLGYDQFGRSCWQNKQTQELRYSPPGQGLALPPRSLADAPLTKLSNGPPPFPPTAIPRAEAFPMPPTQGFGEGVQFHSSALKAPEAASASPTSVKVDTKPRSSPPISRAEEAKRWSLKRDNRGNQYYLNSVTGVSQSAKPDCLKKYTCRR